MRPSSSHRNPGLQVVFITGLLSFLLLPLGFGLAQGQPTNTAAFAGSTAEPTGAVTLNIQRVYLPYTQNAGRSGGLVQEAYPVGWDATLITALDGRLGVFFPQGAVNYPNCTLIVQTPDPQAEWLQFYMYISCQVNLGEPPYYPSLNFPVTISVDYSRLDVTYLDEQRLNISYGYEWLSSAQSREPDAAANPTQPDVLYQLDNIVVDTVNKTVSGQADELYYMRLDPGFTLTDLAAAPGGSAYAAAAPIIYTLQPNGSLQRYLDLTDLAQANGLKPSFQNISANPASGEIYLGLHAYLIGSPTVIYAANGEALRPIYTIPSGEEFWNLTYRGDEDLLYLSMSRVTDNWFGCPIRDIFVREVRASDGTVLGDIPHTSANSPLIDLITNSDGLLLGLTSDAGCFPTTYTGASLSTAKGSAPLSTFGEDYPGFRGAGYLAEDDQGNTYLANTSGNAISVVAGADSQVVGSIPVDSPGSIAVSGAHLFVLSKGKQVVLSTGDRVNTPPPVLMTPSASLSGSDLYVQVESGFFSPIPAHNVLYYNGTRYRMPALQESQFSRLTSEIEYKIEVPQPDPAAYEPLDQQSGQLELKVNGLSADLKTVTAPEVPYKEFQINSGEQSLAVAAGQWVMFSYYNGGAISSEEGLFPEKPRKDLWGYLLYQFDQPGSYHFKVSGDADHPEDMHATVEVTTYGEPETARKTLYGPGGGVLWAGSAALEVPPGALPTLSGGYKVTFWSTYNSYPVQDTISDASLVYHFSFDPEVTQLNHDLTLHLPRVADSGVPVMAFFDPQTGDPFPVESQADPTMADHVVLTIPAGAYPASQALDSADLLRMAKAGGPPGGGDSPSLKPQANWLRRSLNWLGSTGVWHAVGLPNDKIETNHFVILFNTNDCTPTYAGDMLDAFEEAYSHFQTQGYTMPGERVYVKVAPWVASKSTPGVTPGIGSLFNFYIFMNNAMASEYLQDTAVHEFMHVLQKTNATPDGRYMNPTWWEEATAVWAQYDVYPAHRGYYDGDIHPAFGENFMRTGFDSWNSMSAEQMYAAMSLAEYLTQNYGSNAVLLTFINMSVDWNALVGVQKSIEIVTGKKFDDFYSEFAKAYWTQSFEPVKSWTFVDNLTNPLDYASNAIFPLAINQPVNSVFQQGNIASLSSGMVKIYAASSGLPVSFNDTLAQGSIARIQNTCTGMMFYFYDAGLQPVNDWKFEGEVLPGYDELFYDKRLGEFKVTSPVYLIYMDRSYGYTASCAPRLTLEQPTITSVSPQSVAKNTTTRFTVSGGGFGPTAGSIVIGGETVEPATWSPGSVSFDWNSGSLPGTVTVAVITHKSAFSNRLTITITP
jgi:hypothetical protein